MIVDGEEVDGELVERFIKWAGHAPDEGDPMAWSAWVEATRQEREACAKICEETWVDPGDLQVENCHEAAAKIRARSRQLADYGDNLKIIDCPNCRDRFILYKDGRIDGLIGS